MANPEHENVLWQTHIHRRRNVDMRTFDLVGVRCQSGFLEGANFAEADLCKSDLSGAYLKDVSFRGAHLRKARIGLGDLRNADLSGADLTGCDLHSSVLSGASLAMANLTKASLVKARLENVDFTGANLDKTDLRGAKGLTRQQLDSALHGDKAILDEGMLRALGREGLKEVARHGRPARKRQNPNSVDLVFAHPKPTFGDVFLMCGAEHPKFPVTGDFGFARLVDLGVEQCDDYFAITHRGDPIIWLIPLIKSSEAPHHPGPFDAIRIVLDNAKHRDRWLSCVARFRESLRLAAEG